MAIDSEPLGAPGLEPKSSMIPRIRRILLEPKLEWPRIDAEPMTVKGIMTSWVVPLAAIGPIASLIGGQVFGYGALGFVYRPTLASALAGALIAYLLSLLSVWLLGLIIDALAPTFDGTKNPVAAMKVAAFSMTASWVAGIFGLIPMLAILGIVGLYSFYLLYLGLPRLMKVPESKAVTYTIATVVAGIVLFFIVGTITSSIAMRMAGPMVGMSGLR